MDELVFIVFMVGIIIVSRIIASNARDKREKEVYIKTEKEKYESDVVRLTKDRQYLIEQLEKTRKKVANDTHIINSLRDDVKFFKTEYDELTYENLELSAKLAQYEKVALKDFNTISIHLNLLEENKVEGKDREVVQKVLTDLKYKLLRNPQPYIRVFEKELYEKVLDKINKQM